MPAKPHRRKGKYAYQAKKQGGVAHPVPAAPQTSTAPVAATASAGVAAPPRVVSPRPAARTSAGASSRALPVQQHILTRELRNIGILAGIVLVILIILAFILH